MDRSGVTPKYCCAPPSPNLNPVITSSKIKAISYSSHISRSPSRNPSSGRMQPLLHITGSVMIAAISLYRSATVFFNNGRSFQGKTINSSLECSGKPSVQEYTFGFSRLPRASSEGVDIPQLTLSNQP